MRAPPAAGGPPLVTSPAPHFGRVAGAAFILDGGPLPPLGGSPPLFVRLRASALAVQRRPADRGKNTDEPLTFPLARSTARGSVYAEM
jgi:hypothetical protein